MSSQWTNPSAIQINYGSVAAEPIQLFSAKFPINDYPNNVRGNITSDITLQEIRIQSGCAVEVGGSYIHGNVRERFKNIEALHLIVKSNKRDNVERGVACIVNKIENSQRPQPVTKYQERLEVGMEAAVSGFNVIGKIKGDNDGNIKYISGETGVTITMRGRGSGFIEPLTGRESSQPLHMHLEHHSNNENMKKAVSLASDLIRTVKEEWFKTPSGVAQSREDRERGGDSRDDYILSDRERGREDESYTDSYKTTSREDARLSSQPRDDWQIPNRQQSYGSARRSRERSEENDRQRSYDRYGRERKEAEWKRKSPVWERLGDKRLNDKRHDDKRLDDNRFDDKRLDDRRFDDKRLDDRRFDDKRLDEKRFDDKRLDDKRFDDKRLNDKRQRKSPDRVWDGRQNKMSGIDVWDKQSANQTERQARDRESDWGKDLQKMIEEKKKNKKSRWDTSGNNDKTVPNKAVLGVVLDQKKKIEDKLKKVNTVEASTPSTSLVDGVNPLKMNQNELEKLNHRQLLLVSQQQQALLMQITASLTQAISADFSKPPPPAPVVTIPPPHTNPLPTLSLSSLVPPYPPPAPIIKPVTYPQQTVSSEYNQPRDRSPLRDARRDSSPWRSSGRDEANSSGFSSTFRRSPDTDRRDRRSNSLEQRLKKSSMEKIKDRRWRRSPSPDHRSRIAHSPDRQMRRSASRDNRWRRPSSPDQGTRRSRSPDRRWRRSRSPDGRRYSPMRSRNRSLERSPRRDGNERYSPQLTDGQERYSPQLDDDLFTSGYRSVDRRSRSKSPMKNDPERVAKKLLRFRVAVIDCHYVKLLPPDEVEIKRLLDEAQSIVPAWKHHKIEYIGFASDDFIYVLMPYTLEGMKWLIEEKYLTNNGEKRYILFPFEDIYNKIRMRSTIFFDTLEGYMPTEREVLLELGRMNQGLNIDQWKVIKFNQEEKGFFLLASVDLLSYLVLRGINWKPRYRTSYIKLEPLRSEAKVDPRFI